MNYGPRFGGSAQHVVSAQPLRFRPPPFSGGYKNLSPLKKELAVAKRIVTIKRKTDVENRAKKAASKALVDKRAAAVAQFKETLEQATRAIAFALERLRTEAPEAIGQLLLTNETTPREVNQKKVVLGLEHLCGGVTPAFEIDLPKIRNEPGRKIRECEECGKPTFNPVCMECKYS